MKYRYWRKMSALLVASCVAATSSMPFAGVQTANAETENTLEVREGGAVLPLEPSFDLYTEYYEVLAGTRAWVDVVPGLNSFDRVTVNGEVAANGQPFLVPLPIGRSEIEVKGGTFNPTTYRIQAYRSPVSAPDGGVPTPARQVQVAMPEGMTMDASGNVYIAQGEMGTITKFDSIGRIQWEFPGEDSDGFDLGFPGGVALDGSGNVYVTDAPNGRIVKLTPTGGFAREYTVAGAIDLTIDALGNLYALVEDGEPSRITVKKLLGATGATAWTWPETEAETESLVSPWGIALDGTGKVLVAEVSEDATVMQVIDAATGTASASVTLNPGAAYPDFIPGDVAIDGAGRWIVSDRGSDAIHFFASGGTYLTSWNTTGSFSPTALAVSGDFQLDASGKLGVIVSDGGMRSGVQWFEKDGQAATLWAESGLWHGFFSAPADIATSGGGDYYVADTEHGRIEKFDEDGTWLQTYRYPDPEVPFAPDSVAVDALGFVYAADSYHGRIVRFYPEGGIKNELSELAREPLGIKTTPDGGVVIIFGPLPSFGPGMGLIEKYSADLSQVLASGVADNPRKLAVDESGVVYVVDHYTYNVVTYAEVESEVEGETFTEYVKTGEFGEATEGGGEYGELEYPNGIALDGAGHVFVSELTHGWIEVFARDGEYLGRIDHFPGDVVEPAPAGMAIDSNGTLIVADMFHNRIVKFPLAYTNGIADLVADDGQFMSPIVPEDTNYTLKLHRNAENVSLRAVPSDPASELLVEGELHPWDEAMIVSGDETFEFAVRNAAGDTLTYTIDVSKIDTLAEAEAGSYVSFGGERTWITTGTESNKLLSVAPYGTSRMWDDSLVFDGSVADDDPRFRFDPTASGTLANDLGTTFLDSLDEGAGELKQWLVPMSIPVDYLYLNGDGSIDRNGGVSPNAYTASGKAALLTYDEYLRMRDLGLLRMTDFAGAGWEYTWLLMNPLTGAGYQDQYLAHVQNHSDGEVYFYPTNHAVRPVVQLQDNVRIVGGEGTSGSPYTLALPTDPLPTFDVTRDDLAAGAATGSFTVALSFVRSMPKDAEVTVTFPSDFYTASIPAVGALEVRVAGTAIAGASYTIDPDTGDVTLPLPVDVPYGRTVEIEFLPEAGIRNAAVSDIYDLAVTIPSLSEAPVATTLWVDPPHSADLGIVEVESEDGDFLEGEQNRKLTFQIANGGLGATVGEVKVATSLTNFTDVTLEGVGWMCDDATDACTRDDALAPGDAYEPIVAYVDVEDPIDFGTGVLRVTVSGGGDAVPENNMYDIDRSLVRLPSIGLSVNGSEGWVYSADTRIQVTQPSYGLPLEADSFEYVWSASPTAPTEATWTPFANGDEVSRTVDGTWYLHVRAADANDNAAYFVSNSYQIDRTGPEMEVTLETADGTPYPGDGTLVGQVVLLRELRSWDNNGAPPTHSFSVNGGEWRPIEELTAFNVSGEYELLLRATDSLGNATVKTFDIHVQTTAPALTWTASPHTPTNGNVSIRAIAADATKVKWAEGTQDASYFHSNGETVTRGADGFYSVTVPQNGYYTIYAVNASGLETVQDVQVWNIYREAPTATFTPSNTALTNENVTIFGVGDPIGSGNGLGELRWAYGDRSVNDFADPTFGEPLEYSDYQFSFGATQNGTYSVYLTDLAGNRAVRKVTVGNIERRAPALTLEHPNEPTNQSVTISVSDTVYGTDIGNALESLKWEKGTQSAEYFATAGNSIDLAAKSFDVGANDVYTVFARDLAGNETITFATVDNIYATAPTISIARDPDAPTSGNVTVSVTISVYGADSGNGIQSVQWIRGDGATALPAEAEQSIEVLENGTYTILVTDLAGNTMSQTVGIGNIYRAPPVLTAAMTPEGPTHGAVTVIVSATAVGSGNGIDAILWAPGERTLAEFPAAGQVVSGSYFEVTSNGKYTVYARDLAGNSVIRIVEIGQIQPLPTDGSPKVAFIAVDAGANSVSVVFDRPLDRSKPLSGSDFSLSGVNGSIVSVAYDPMNARAVIIGVASSDSTLVWQPTASLSAAIGAVRSEAGVVNSAIANAAVVTPAKRKALTDAINPPASGERLAMGKIIAYLIGGGNVDVNGDGATDKSDIEFLLQLIEPQAFTGSEEV